MNNKLLVILGPTASGKSDLAIKIAKLFNGEVVSADSRQVYIGMDIGSAKVIRDNDKKGYFSDGINHHLLDVSNPKEYFTVSQYKELADKAIEGIQKQNKLPILCGGTGLYISSVIEGWQFPNVLPNENLRKDLESKTTKQLFDELSLLDQERAKKIDAKNRRRLIRAIEIAKNKGKVPKLSKNAPDWNIFIIGIKKEVPELKQLILERIDQRIDLGMIREVETLKESGVSSKRLEGFGLEYKWINRYLENKVTIDEMKQKIFMDTCHFIKRQMTWFKKMKNIWWIDDEKQAFAALDRWLKTNKNRLTFNDEVC